MNAQNVLDQALKVKVLSDETLLMMRDPEAYDLNVNGIRHIRVKHEDGEYLIVRGGKVVYDRTII